MRAEVGPAVDLRGGSGTGRLIVPVVGGTFEGPELKGSILPLGADWLLTSQGFARLDVRILLKTEGAQHIYMTYRGVHTITAEIRDRIGAGEDVDPSEYYFRTTPLFETNAERYDWLNRIVAVGVGKRTRATVDYRVFQIL